MALKEFFNPYDLNDIADIDKYIKAWQERRLRELIHSAHLQSSQGIQKLVDSSSKPYPAKRGRRKIL